MVARFSDEVKNQRGYWSRIEPSWPASASGSRPSANQAQTSSGSSPAGPWRRSAAWPASSAGQRLAEVLGQPLRLGRLAGHQGVGLDVEGEVGRRALDPQLGGPPGRQRVVRRVDLDDAGSARRSTGAAPRRCRRRPGRRRRLAVIVGSVQEAVPMRIVPHRSRPGAARRRRRPGRRRSRRLDRVRDRGAFGRCRWPSPNGTTGYMPGRCNNADAAASQRRFVAPVLTLAQISSHNHDACDASPVRSSRWSATSWRLRCRCGRWASRSPRLPARPDDRRRDRSEAADRLRDAVQGARSARAGRATSRAAGRTPTSRPRSPARAAGCIGSPRSGERPSPTPGVGRGGRGRQPVRRVRPPGPRRRGALR